MAYVWERHYIVEYDSIVNGYNTYNGGGGIPQLIKCVETDEIFKSAADAARTMHLDQSNLNKVLKGKRKTVNGYHFTYIDIHDVNKLLLEEAERIYGRK